MFGSVLMRARQSMALQVCAAGWFGQADRPGAVSLATKMRRWEPYPRVHISENTGHKVGVIHLPTRNYLIFCVPKGIRTPVTAVKGRCVSPRARYWNVHRVTRGREQRAADGDDPSGQLHISVAAGRRSRLYRHEACRRVRSEQAVGSGPRTQIALGIALAYNAAMPQSEPRDVATNHDNVTV